MKIYKVILTFTNLDNSLYTDAQATMLVEITADDYYHADLLAHRLKKVMDADHYELE